MKRPTSRTLTSVLMSQMKHIHLWLLDCLFWMESNKKIFAGSSYIQPRAYSRRDALSVCHGLQDTAGKEREKSERLRFGRFFYRFPNGESGYGHVPLLGLVCVVCISALTNYGRARRMQMLQLPEGTDAACLQCTEITSSILRQSNFVSCKHGATITLRKLSTSSVSRLTASHTPPPPSRGVPFLISTFRDGKDSWKHWSRVEVGDAPSGCLPCL